MSTSHDTTLQKVPVQTTVSDSQAHIYILSNLLSPSECEGIIETHKDLQPSNVTPNTVRTRQAFDDERLANLIWQRVKPHFDNDEDLRTVVDEDREVWDVTGLNERWRLCLYEDGGKFSAHQDGRRLSSVNTQSFMTLNIYLLSLPASFGGATRFFASSPYEHPNIPATYRNQPVQGCAALFRDFLWHDGEEVTGGQRKYLLRTDVVYERRVGFDFERVTEGWSEERKGSKALSLAEGLEDAGRSEEAVWWYKRALRFGVGG